MDTLPLNYPLTVDDFLKLVVGLLFCAVIFLSFLYGTIPYWVRTLKQHRQKISSPASMGELQKEPTKIIGGLAILLIALVSNNTWIYAIALFIGGLLIASERFMVSLAAIFNSSRDNVAQIPQLWHEPLNRLEIENKQQEEAVTELKEETKDIDAQTKEVNQKHSPTINYREVLEKIRNYEAEVIRKIEQKLITKSIIIKPYVRLTPSLGVRASVILDAVGIDPQNKDKPIFGIEVKYFTSFRKQSLERSIRIAENISSEAKMPILLAIVFEKDIIFDKEKTSRYTHGLLHNVGIVYYQADSNGEVKPLDDGALNRLMPNYFAPH